MCRPQSCACGYLTAAHSPTMLGWRLHWRLSTASTPMWPLFSIAIRPRSGGSPYGTHSSVGAFKRPHASQPDRASVHTRWSSHPGHARARENECLEGTVLRRSDEELQFPPRRPQATVEEAHVLINIDDAEGFFCKAIFRGIRIHCEVRQQHAVSYDIYVAAAGQLIQGQMFHSHLDRATQSAAI